MTGTLYGLLDWSWVAVLAVYVATAVLDMAGKLPDRWYYLSRAIADLLYLTRNLVVGIHEQRLTALTFAWLAAMFLAYDIWQYRRHRDDDDDWGKRLKAWGKSHIPRPTIVAIRPAESGAS